MHSGTLSGSLMPPSRKPWTTCALKVNRSLGLKLAMNAGREAVRLVDPGTDTIEVPVLSLPNIPSKTCSRSSPKL